MRTTSGARRLDLESPGPHGGEGILLDGPEAADARIGLVLLHGRGAGARDILGLGQEVAPADALLVAPQAARSTWYPDRFVAPRDRNQPWLDSALGRIEAIGDWLERAGLPTARTVVVGFSQGACLAAEAVAGSQRTWGGLASLTGGLIGPPGRPLTIPRDREGLPVLLSSGDPDPHVPWSRVEETAEAYRKAGAAVDVRRFPGRPHTVTTEEVELVRRLVGKLASV